MPPLSCHKNNEIQVESDAFVVLSKPKELMNATPPNVCHLPLKQKKSLQQSIDQDCPQTDGKL
jgi:hypothetical protein